jgi:hypothetical protein
MVTANPDPDCAFQILGAIIRHLRLDGSHEQSGRFLKPMEQTNWGKSRRTTNA